MTSSEGNLRDSIFSGMFSFFASKLPSVQSHGGRVSLILSERMFWIQKELELPYEVPIGSAKATLTHKSDFVITLLGTMFKEVPVMNVELKFKSNVTDAFKARSYDQMYLRQNYPHLKGCLLYVRPVGGGLTFAQVARICQPFDEFIFLNEAEIGKKGWHAFYTSIEARMIEVAGDCSILAPQVLQAPGPSA